jgi:DNA polymerase-1
VTPERPVVIIDGLSVFMRHYCANPSMSSNGEHMGGFAGFLGSVREISQRFTPSKIVVVWEGGGSKKRRLIDKAYKNGRRPAKLNRYYDDIPDTQTNRNSQLSKLVSALRHTPVKQIYVPDCEGDDAVAHLTRVVMRDEGKHVIIVSSDRDFYQLISDSVSVWSPGKRKLIGPAECVEEFNVHPNNFALAKAIVGDPGDHVLGVKGVGYKSLSKRVPGFDSDNQLCFQDVLSVCQVSRETSKAKIYVDIPDETERIKKNIRLVSLDAGTLPATIEKKIEEAYKSSVTGGKPNKIELYRMIIREGLSKIDVDSIFFSLRTVSA